MLGLLFRLAVFVMNDDCRHTFWLKLRAAQLISMRLKGLQPKPNDGLSRCEQRPPAAAGGKKFSTPYPTLRLAGPARGRQAGNQAVRQLPRSSPLWPLSDAIEGFVTNSLNGTCGQARLCLQFCAGQRPGFSSVLD
jgi:hypothetical protein